MSANAPARSLSVGQLYMLQQDEAYIVEVGIGEGWNTDVLRLGTTWKMLLSEQQR